MAVAVQADLVAGVGDHAALFRESLEGVAGDEPGGFDVVLFKHLEKATDADRSGEEAWGSRQLSLRWKKDGAWCSYGRCCIEMTLLTAGDVAGAVLASVRA